jgi:hypothetical protein
MVLSISNQNLFYLCTDIPVTALVQIYIISIDSVSETNMVSSSSRGGTIAPLPTRVYAIPICYVRVVRSLL